MLKLIDIKKDYKIAAGTVHALKGVNLAFRPNEFVCILGQSGCGKTTLLNIIGGLDQYTSGDLVIQGKSTRNFKDRDWDVYRNHRIGFIFQSYNLIPHQTVLGNVELALTIAGIGMEERRERAKQALERVGLGNELDKRPNQLSGGQMQRVAIARALVNNPDILLADEPTGALDSATSVQIMELIKEIAGERLVIMVTHNPELAVQYASRIVRLKDGLVEEDSNPYSDEEEQKEYLEQKESGDTQKKNRARMSLLASLSLSARNLLTKKGRTILTSVAGSIGIISVCLVLALSAGFQSYITRTEEDMLSYYPVTVSENSFDMMSIMARMQEVGEAPDLSELDDKVYVNSFLTNMAQGMTVQNDISDTYLSYVQSMNEEWYYAIHYGYGTSISDNLFTAAQTGATAAEAKERYLSLSELKTFYTQELTMQAEEYARLAYMIDYLGGVVNVMPDTADFTDESFGSYILSQYDIVAGSFPTNENETVLVVGGNNDMTDLTLVQLGFLDEVTFLSLFGLGENEETKDDFLTVSFEEILKKQFVLYYNDAVYTENAGATAMYPYLYRGEKESMDVSDGEGMKLKVSGILRLKDEMTYGCLSSGLNLTEATIEQYLKANSASKLVEWMKNKDNTLSYEANGTVYNLYRSPAEHLNSYFTLYSTEIFGQTVNVYINVDNEQVVRHVGGETSPNSIAFYLKDFESKEQVLSYLDEWNNLCASGGTYGGVTLAEEDRITYTDTVGMLMTMMQTMLDVITYVLVAFTAISLVVSSVMIGIITYVSVVERVKEIGVLRSLGARKRDIKNLFNAETFMIGLAAGIIGIAVTYLLEIPINAIIFSLSGIGGIASLSPVSAIIMVVISVVLTLISGLIPASAAAKKDPVIALRTE